MSPIAWDANDDKCPLCGDKFFGAMRTHLAVRHDIESPPLWASGTLRCLCGKEFPGNVNVRVLYSHFAKEGKQCVTIFLMRGKE